MLHRRVLTLTFQFPFSPAACFEEEPGCTDAQVLLALVNLAWRTASAAAGILDLHRRRSKCDDSRRQLFRLYGHLKHLQDSSRALHELCDNVCIFAYRRGRIKAQR